MVDFEKMINEISISLKRFIFYQVSDHHLTEDIYQEVITTAWINLNSLNDISKFKQWIFQIARNRIKDHYRKKYKADFEVLDIDNIKDYRFNVACNDEELYAKDIVLEVFEHLENKDKQILEMFYISQYSLNELSTLLNIPVGTVKSRLFAARKNFKLVYLTKFKMEVINMSNNLIFPNNMPNVIIKKVNTEPFVVDCQEIKWWFFKPIENYNCLWASYDYPEKKLSSMVNMKYLNKATIHGIDCIEFSTTDYNFVNNQWDLNKRIMYARLTDKYVQWVADINYDKNGVKMFKSFMDEDFIINFGNIDPIKGNERIIKDEGKYQILENDSILTVDSQKSSGCGYYNIKINDSNYLCLRVLEPDGDILVEAFISREGDTILFRRYNSVNWALNSEFGYTKWDERFPNNQTIIIDGIKYVHWYDCITEKVIRK